MASVDPRGGAAPARDPAVRGDPGGVGSGLAGLCALVRTASANLGTRTWRGKPPAAPNRSRVRSPGSAWVCRRCHGLLDPSCGLAATVAFAATNIPAVKQFPEQCTSCGRRPVSLWCRGGSVRLRGGEHLASPVRLTWLRSAGPQLLSLPRSPAAPRLPPRLRPPRRPAPGRRRRRSRAAHRGRPRPPPVRRRRR